MMYEYLRKHTYNKIIEDGYNLNQYSSLVVVQKMKRWNELYHNKDNEGYLTLLFKTDPYIGIKIK